MKTLRRILELTDWKKKSLFLFGPRQTGKSFLLRNLFPNAKIYNLLLSDTFFRLNQRPGLIREEILSSPHFQSDPVIIDEIQKLPILLDEVQALIEEKDIHFILTGSSARKLKRGSANLLAGRAWIRSLFPLVSEEIPSFLLERVLNFGALPSVYLSDSPDEELDAYVGTYLKEEIQAEGLTRKLENFSRFLTTAALQNGELTNFANIASDCGVPARTVREYFQILEDTLIGTLLEPYGKTKRRKAITTAKFYFFDVGVANRLGGRIQIREKTPLFGQVLEHFIFTELRAYVSYRKGPPLSFWRSQSGYEVDFLLGDSVGIEVKGTSLVTEKHLSGLRALNEDLPLKRKIVVSMDTSPRKIEDFEILPVKLFLKALWASEFL
jgi:predicted AAA+ superfamily ATPase